MDGSIQVAAGNDRIDLTDRNRMRCGGHDNPHRGTGEDEENVDLSSSSMTALLGSHTERVLLPCILASRPHRPGSGHQ